LRSTGSSRTRWKERREEYRRRPRIYPSPETGWDKGTETLGHVIDYVTKEVRRRIAFVAQNTREGGLFVLEDLRGGWPCHHWAHSVGDWGEEASTGSRDNSYARSTLCLLALGQQRRTGTPGKLSAPICDTQETKNFCDGTPGTLSL